MSNWLHSLVLTAGCIALLIHVTISKKASKHSRNVHCSFNIRNLLFLKIFLISGRHIVCLQPNKLISGSFITFFIFCVEMCYTFIQPIFCLLLMTEILLLSEWKLNIGHLMWQSSKVWFMFQRSNWQHFLHLQAALVRFFDICENLGRYTLGLKRRWLVSDHLSLSCTTSE